MEVPVELENVVFVVVLVVVGKVEEGPMDRVGRKCFVEGSRHSCCHLLV